MVTLIHIKFMGLLTNYMIGPLGLKVGSGDVRELKVRGASDIFTQRCYCTVIC